MIFIRNFNWLPCQDYITTLGKRDKEIIDNYKVKFIVIGCGNVKGISIFAKDSNYPKENIFVDSEAKLYSKVGLIRANTLKDMKSEK